MTRRIAWPTLHGPLVWCFANGPLIVWKARSSRPPRCVFGFPPLIFDLEAENDTDHVFAVFRSRGHWGAIAKSNIRRLPLSRTCVSFVARAGDELLQYLFQYAG